MWNNNIQQIKSLLNPCECAMLNNFELCSVHAESADKGRWSIFNTNIDYAAYDRKGLTSNKVKLKPAEGKCRKCYR